MSRPWLPLLFAMLLGACPAPGADAPASPPATGARFRLVVLDPGHFHASLVQKFMYADVDPLVHVYAPAGEDVSEHLKRVARFNVRADQPTHWREQVYTAPDYLEKMLAEKAGNVVVISGNNTRKTDYIVRAIDAGLNVLGDKPMVLTPPDLVRLQQAFKTAEAKHVLLYDIMTERNEVTTALQRELSQQPALFGTLAPGSPEVPSITKESVHHYSKLIAGVPLRRPPWFFDVRQEGDGLGDVMTHLVDLVQWEAFPEQALSPADVTVLSARRSPTAITREQFKEVTGADNFPAFLRDDVKDGVLQTYANGEINYRLRGIHAKVSVKWNFAAPAGAGDTHYSIMRGTRANLVIRQGAAQGYKPVLYIEQSERAERPVPAATAETAIAALQPKYPGIGLRREGDSWVVTVPARYDVGHEAHFAQVMENFLRYLREGRLPSWEVPCMLTKYSTMMQAYTLARAR
ncbi:MAG: Gfo/Idh/MocA family oxidoreductase [Verrucomicrobia bacterium]|nr:Gfo/Idh/MocA family oxidoreductase [Verrucomicrobiota bacterium]